MDWDGTERRAAERAAAASAGGESQVGSAATIAATIAGLVLQLAGLTGLVILDDHQQREADRSERVDASLTCYIVKISQAGQAAGDHIGEILTDCGFFTGLTGAGRKGN